MGRRRVVAAAALAVLQLVVLVSLLVGGRDEPRDAPVTLVAPPVLATVLAERAESDPGHPVRLRTAETVDAARRDVLEGRSVAAIVVDLRFERDTVYVAGANGTDLNAGVQRAVQQVESRYGRRVVIEDLVPTREGDDDARRVFALVGLCCVLGLVAPIAVTWVAGPVAPTLRRGVRRLAIIGASSVGLGLPVAVAGAVLYDGGFAGWWALTTLTIGAVAVATTALESVFGVLGIGLAMTVFVLSATPLLLLEPTPLLPAPWHAITPWLPHGAALEAGRGIAYFAGAPPRPLLALTVWVGLSVMTLAVARRERGRDERVEHELNERSEGPTAARR